MYNKTMFSIIMIIALVLTSSISFAGIESGTTSILVKGNSAFAIEMYHQLDKPDRNLFFSPFSISTSLAMTYGGACGNTADEMAEVMHFTLDQNVMHPAFHELTMNLTSSAAENNQKLNIVNGLCLTGNDVSGSFKDLLKNSYNAEIFAGDLDVVNDWVYNKTEGKIRKILESLKPNTVCVLLNAINFKGVWESRFNVAQTHDAPFIVTPNNTIDVPFMYQKNMFKILIKRDFRVVSIPYKGNQMSMIVFIPDKVNGLKDLEMNLNESNLNQWMKEIDSTTSYKIELFIPKVNLQRGYDLIPPCTKLGIKDAFVSNEADFCGMGYKKGNLWIGQIKHKAAIEVNEEGSEAVAATAVEMVTKSTPHYPVFKADHPFMFLIRDNVSGTILFMGRVVNPVQE